jgi:hypothetical protein
MITPYQAAELRRRIEAALDVAWKAGVAFSDGQLTGKDRDAKSEQHVFRYVDHLAKRKSKSEKR